MSQMIANCALPLIVWLLLPFELRAEVYAAEDGWRNARSIVPAARSGESGDWAFSRRIGVKDEYTGRD